jgi:two-component system OmpR family sensor kinase
MIEHSRYKEILKKSINHIDELTNELLEIEKLNADTTTLNLQTHSIDTILALALSKMQVEDEESIDVKIIELFQTKADINYLAIAIKNLIDNALKYKEKGNVEIVIKPNLLEIKNYAKPLTRELAYYTQTFTQENSSRNTNGYGLGLNLVKRILERHNFNLIYSYNQSKICFTIQF